MHGERSVVATRWIDTWGKVSCSNKVGGLIHGERSVVATRWVGAWGKVSCSNKVGWCMGKGQL